MSSPSIPSFARPKQSSATRSRLQQQRTTAAPTNAAPHRTSPTLPSSTSVAGRLAPASSTAATAAIARKSTCKLTPKATLLSVPSSSNTTTDAKERLSTLTSTEQRAPVASFQRPVGFPRTTKHPTPTPAPTPVKQRPSFLSGTSRTPVPTRTSTLYQNTNQRGAARRSTNPHAAAANPTPNASVNQKPPPTDPGAKPPTTALVPPTESILDRTWNDLRLPTSPRSNGTFYIAPNSARDRRTPTLGGVEHEDEDERPSTTGDDQSEAEAHDQELVLERDQSACTPLLQPIHPSRLSVAEELASMPIVEQPFATPAAPRLQTNMMQQQQECFYTPLPPPDTSAALIAKGRLSLGPNPPHKQEGATCVVALSPENLKPRNVELPASGATCFVLSRSAKRKGSNAECFSVSRRSRRSLSRHKKPLNDSILSIAPSPRSLVAQMQEDPELRELVAGHEVIIPDTLAHQALMGSDGGTLHATRKRGRTVIRMTGELDMRQLEKEYVTTSASPKPLKMTDVSYMMATDTSGAQSDLSEDPTSSSHVLKGRAGGLGLRGVGHRQESEVGVFAHTSMGCKREEDDTEEEGPAFPIIRLKPPQETGGVHSVTPVAAGTGVPSMMERADTSPAAGSVASWMRYDVSPMDSQLPPSTEAASTSAEEGAGTAATPLLQAAKRVDSLPSRERGVAGGMTLKSKSRTPPPRAQTADYRLGGRKGSSPQRAGGVGSTSEDNTTPSTSYMLKRLAQHSRDARGATPIMVRGETMRSSPETTSVGGRQSRPPLSSRKSLASLRQ